jgi:predicted Fe-S protein YdhL (DUF1289 family)
LRPNYKYRTKIINEADQMIEQLEFFEISSPCNGSCASDERGYCLGCLRSREERFHWLSMTEIEKREVLRLCRQRFLRRQRGLKKMDNNNSFEQTSLFD